MPPIPTKGKGKVKERSRNTTPSSVLSAPVSATTGSTAYLDVPISALSIPTNILYEDIIERHGDTGGIPDPRALEALAEDLKQLGQLAETRDTTGENAIRASIDRRKTRVEEEEYLEIASKEAEEKARLKRAAEVNEAEDAMKGVTMKKRKDRSRVREERPLAHGAHGVARQDGLDPAPKGKPMASSTKIKSSTGSGSSSSLSPPSQILSPSSANPKVAKSDHGSPAGSSSSDDHQPPPAASVPQYQTFGANPLTFDDPTIYHIRDVRPDMSDDEKNEIFNVASFPRSDLSDLIAGTPPDKDFSNAKPTNQVHANTFNTYLEPYFRPLTEEDLAFLRERGDRVTPFTMPRRGTRSYKDIWAEEDGVIAVDSQHEKERLPANQPRGSLEQMDDDLAETDKISGPPMLNRLLSTMRFEHRPEEKEKINGMFNGDSGMNGLSNGDGEISNEPNGDDRPPATYFPESSNPNWKVPSQRQDYNQVDERLKGELRFLGFIGQDDEPDYDAHYDDEVAQRLRFLQGQLRKQMIINGARKARLLQIAEEQMGYQEFATIREDLDNQVNQAFTKRNRTMGKGKKNVKRPGGAGGGSHFPTGGTGPGVSKPGIGDAARIVLDRRRRWNAAIEPVFSEDITQQRGADDSIFSDKDMAPLIAAETEKLDEELAEMNG